MKLLKIFAIVLICSVTYQSVYAGEVSYTYDALGRLTTVTLGSSADGDSDGIPDASDVHFRYDYDPAGNITARLVVPYDNCPGTKNTEQADLDGDSLGDVCDSDIDGDEMPNTFEIANQLAAMDDGTGDFTRGPDGDLDLDGSTNLDEYYAGSLANDADSRVVDMDIVLHEGLNLFGYPLTESGGLTSHDLLTFLGAEDEIEKILIHDQSTNTYIETYYDGTSPAGEDLDLFFGDGILVYARVEKTKPINSMVREFNSYITCETVDLNAGLNLVTFPCAPAGYTSHQLLADLGNSSLVSSVQHFNTTTGNFETAGYVTNGEIYGLDFLIVPGKGYIIHMK